MNVYYFDRTADPTSLPLEELLAALRAKDIEHDACQIVADLDMKGCHSTQGVSTGFSIFRSFCRRPSACVGFFPLKLSINERRCGGSLRITLRLAWPAIVMAVTANRFQISKAVN